MKRACEHLGSNAYLCKDVTGLTKAQRIIFPGVGAADSAMASLKKSGLDKALIGAYQQGTPILGICLGHQSIGQVFGSKIVKANHVMHGKTSEIHHNGLGVFSGLPSPFLATRYHSLVVDEVPLDMELTGWTLKDLSLIHI